MTDGTKPIPRLAAPRGFPPDAMIEELTQDWGFHIRSARELESFQSGFQAVEVHDTVPFGKLFRLDGHFMTSEKDEFFYHENLVHPAALTHAAPVRALIVGGGDGGSAEELFKHPSIESVTLAEIDASVVAISRKYLSAVHKGSLDDPRLTLKIGDGFEYVRSGVRTLRLDRARLDRPRGPVRSVVHARLLPRVRGAPRPLGRDDAAHCEPDRAPRPHSRDARLAAASVPRRHSLSHVDSALRRPVDDGVRIGDARSPNAHGR